MAIYRDLVFNNVASLLARSFPVVKRIVGDRAWRDLIRDFLVRHRAQTPLFLELPQELLQFLMTSRAGDPRDPPFLLELAHYEWVELALETRDEEPAYEDLDAGGDLVAGHPILSPLARSLTYRFPVHRMGPDWQPDEPPPEPTHLVVYRSEQDRVGFLQINAVTQRLLILIKQMPLATGYEVLMQLATELSHPEPQRLVDFGAQVLGDLRAKKIVLGTRSQEARR